MSKNHSLGIIVIAILVPALSALAQAGKGPGRGPHVQPPFTAEFKITRVRTLPNGTTATTETKEVMARDQDLRRMNATTTAPAGNRPPVTNFHVSDPTTGDEISWNSLIKVAHDIRRPVGADRHGCWATPDGHNHVNFGAGHAAGGPPHPPAPSAAANSPAASPLAQNGPAPGLPSASSPPAGQNVKPVAAKPAPAQPSHPPGNAAHQDLGTDTIKGVEVHGQRTTVTIPAGTEGNNQPIVRTEETWMAPSLGMALRSISDDPRMGKSDREVVKLDLDNPDPSLFQPPAGYKVDTEAMQPVACTQ